MPSPPPALKSEAERLLRAGHVKEAIAAYETLLLAEPQQPDAWYNLGYLQHQARLYEPALLSYEQALRQGIDGAEEVHLNRAVILAENLKRSDEAMHALRASLALQPRYLPALVNLGNIHEQRGERAPAQQCYEAALAVQPDHALALSRLVNLKRFTSAQDPLILRLGQLLARAGHTPGDYADLAFGMGKALDDSGAYERAFAAYQAANRAARVAYGPRPIQYHRQAHERFVDGLIRLSELPCSAPPPQAHRPLVFICGMFRSGSTLLEQIFASHPGVTAGGEIDLLPELARRELPALLGSVGELPAEPVQQMRQAYLDGIAQQYPGASLLTDKRPDNFLYIGLIKRLFPSARILHTRRQVLDNCLSVFFLHLGPTMPYALDLEDIAHWYRQYRRLMNHWQALYGDDIVDIDYDRLVEDPRPQIERALAHCGLGWDEACLDFHATPSIVMTPSAWQVRQPLYRRSSGRWRNYAVHLDALRAALGDYAAD